MYCTSWSFFLTQVFFRSWSRFCREPEGFDWRGHFMRHGPHGEGFEGGFGVRRPCGFWLTSWSWMRSRLPSWPACWTKQDRSVRGGSRQPRTLADFSRHCPARPLTRPKPRAGQRAWTAACKVRDTLIASLGKIHAILSPEQRGKRTDPHRCVGGLTTESMKEEPQMDTDEHR